MPRPFVSMSRHPDMAAPNHTRTADYQLADGRTVSGETLAGLLAQPGSATAMVACLVGKGLPVPPWLREAAAAEVMAR